MYNRKKLQDLTIRDNFLFVAVMIQQENCKGFLEMVLGIQIERIEVSYEKSFIYNPEYKGVRLDVYARDEQNTRYDVEMQVARENLGMRTRYYHSQMDMELLESGEAYEELPATYVIFICDFDPFGLKKYCYTFENRCEEELNLKIGDKAKSIFLSTKGDNPEEIPKEMWEFLKFIGEDTPTNDTASEDVFVKQLQESIRSLKKNREMGQRYMLIKDLVQEEAKKAEARGELNAKKEDILELLEDKGTINNKLHSRIMGEKDKNILKAMLKAAAKSDSLEQFEELISNL